MKPPLHPRLREILRAEGPLSVSTLAERVNSKPITVRAALRNMPDAYIEDWGVLPIRGQYPALWWVVVPPADAPYPQEL